MWSVEAAPADWAVMLMAQVCALALIVVGHLKWKFRSDKAGQARLRSAREALLCWAIAATLIALSALFLHVSAKAPVHQPGISQRR